jgi:RNA polymerase sigma-70 factor (ECF subfamily)
MYSIYNINKTRQFCGGNFLYILFTDKNNKINRPVSFSGIHTFYIESGVKGVIKMNSLQKKQYKKIWSNKETDIKNTYQKLKRYCVFLTKNEWDGSDLAQETITKAIMHYECPTVIHHSLLQKIAYNHWIDIVRRRQRETLQEEIYPNDNNQSSMERSFLITDFLIGKLTPKQAVVFFLKEAFDYQASEIAASLNITEGAVKAILHRSRNRLNKDSLSENILLEKLWNEENKEEMLRLFNISLQEEDPSVLLEAIPTLLPAQPETKSYALPAVHSLPAHTPSNIFKCSA